MRTLLAAIVLAVLLTAPAVAKITDPGAAACETWPMVLDRATRSASIGVADLGPDLSRRLAANLKHFEAIDLTGANLIVTRRPGAGSSRVEAFRDGCRVRSVAIDNRYLDILLKIELGGGN